MLAIATAFKTLNKRTHHEEGSGIDICRQRRVGRAARPRQEAVPAAKRVEQPAPVSVTLSAWSVTLDKAGKERFKRAESAKPGDVIEYRAELRNVSRATLKDQALTLPVPPGTAYVPSSARPAQAQARADGGKFEAMPLMRVGATRRARKKNRRAARGLPRCAGR